MTKLTSSMLKVEGSVSTEVQLSGTVVPAVMVVLAAGEVMAMAATRSGAVREARSRVLGRRCIAPSWTFLATEFRSRRSVGTMRIELNWIGLDWIESDSRGQT